MYWLHCRHVPLSFRLFFERLHFVRRGDLFRMFGLRELHGVYSWPVLSGRDQPLCELRGGGVSRIERPVELRDLQHRPLLSHKRSRGIDFLLGLQPRLECPKFRFNELQRLWPRSLFGVGCSGVLELRRWHLPSLS